MCNCAQKNLQANKNLETENFDHMMLNTQTTKNKV